MFISPLLLRFMILNMSIPEQLLSIGISNHTTYKDTYYTKIEDFRSYNIYVPTQSQEINM